MSDKVQISTECAENIIIKGEIRNIFAIDVGRYTNNARTQKDNFKKAKSIWDEAMQVIAAA